MTSVKSLEFQKQGLEVVNKKKTPGAVHTSFTIFLGFLGVYVVAR